MLKHLIGLVVVLFCLVEFTSDAEAQDLGKIGWSLQCDVTQFATIDPITGNNNSHLHMFLGTKPTMSSTLATMRQQQAECTRSQDTSGYWIPALKHAVTNERVLPDRTNFYYRKVLDREITPAPADLRMIAGDHMATAGNQQPTSVVNWGCVRANNSVYGSYPEPRDCVEDDAKVRLVVAFPQCWDGRNLDSANHQDHMSYPRGGECPTTHPVAIPNLRMQMTFPSRAEGGVRNWDAVYFASGGRYSMHMDWWNTWRNSEGGMNYLTENCINANVVCQNSTP